MLTSLSWFISLQPQLLPVWHTLIIIVPIPQNSFYKLMMGDNKSEKFFKVLHDRMKEAQTEIKATVSVNVGEMTHKANEKELENGEAPPTQHLSNVESFEVTNYSVGFSQLFHFES